VRLPPDVLEVVATHFALLVHISVEVGCVRGLGVNFTERRRPGLIVVRGTGNFLARTALDDPAVVPPIVVQICLNKRRLRWSRIGSRVVVVHNLRVGP